MNVNSISFGRKIPRYTCEIQSRATGKFIPATIYEYDCKDESDYEEIKALDRKWAFKTNIAKNMEQKHAIQTYFHEKSNNSFYMLKANGEILGLAQVNNCNGISNIDYITTKPHNPFKYVGQSLLAIVVKQIFENFGKCLTIDCVSESARPFYVDKCKFEETTKDRLYMGREQMQDFIQRTEQKTQGNFIDIKE